MAMYLVFSIVALLFWSGSDVFSKAGTDETDKNSHWKVTFSVGLIMGIHFLITLIGGVIIDNNGGPEAVPKFVASLFYTDFVMKDFLVYLPVAFLYILAMVVGYIGLRYIELSISSPICNCSGSLALIICACIKMLGVDLDIGSIIGVILVTIGIVSLGIVDNFEDKELKELRRQESNKKYTAGIIAFLIPVFYLIIDALGTVGDELIFHYELITDYAANSAFELTFFFLAIFCFIWVKYVKKDKLFSKGTGVLYLGGLCETLGQVFYMAVMFSDFSVGMVIISAYCAMSLLWSKIYLKEKLSLLHYLTILVTFAGLVVLGIFSPV